MGPVTRRGRPIFNPLGSPEEPVQTLEREAVASHGTPPAPARRRFLRGALALLAFAVSVGVSFGAPDAAQAFATPPVPVVIDTAVSMAASEETVTAAAGATACAVSMVCLGITSAVAVGILGYQTKDTWLPWVNDLFGNGAADKTVNPASGAHCAVATSLGQGTSGRESLTFKGSMTGGNCLNGIGTVFFDVACTGGTANNWSQGFDFGQPPYAITVQAGSGCPAGQTLVHAQAYATDQAGRGVASDTVSWNPPWTAAQNQQTTSVQCQHQDGSGTVTTISDTDTGNTGRFAVPSCSRLGNDWFPIKTTISVGPDATHQTKIADVVPKSDWFTSFADCFTNGVMTCTVKVWVGGVACTVGASACVHWPDNNTAQCQLGAHAVPLTDCNALKSAYDPATTTSQRTVTSTNPDGSTNVGTAAPAPATSTGTDTGTFPKSGTNPDAPGTAPDAGTDPNTQNCYGAAWGWNPVDWILVPVKCALTWAFVPKVPFSDRMTGITSRISGRAPFSWVAGLGGIAAVVPGGNCPDWTINVGSMHKNVVCDSTFTGAIRTARPVLFAMMSLLALWPLIRSIAYASIPILAAKAGER